jgi:hypothetical protein
VVDAAEALRLCAPRVCPAPDRTGYPLLGYTAAASVDMGVM